MNIAIRNYLAGSYLLEQEPGTWDAIAVLDSGLRPTRFVAEHAQRHLFLQMDDVDRPIQGKRMPTANDIQAALDFAAGSDRLLVCCRAGQSRSAAVGFVIGCKRLGLDAACHLLNPRRHQPNGLIVKLGAICLHDQGVLRTLEKWQATHRDIKVIDYADDIEREIVELERRDARNRVF